MRKFNGRFKKTVSRDSKTTVDLGRSHRRAFSYQLLWLIPFLSGCGLKKTAIVAGASSIGAGVGSLVSGTAGTIVGAPAGAIVGQAIAATTQESKTIESAPIHAGTVETVVNQTPTNFWDVISSLGMWAGLIILVPLILGILLHGPVQFKKKRGKRR